MQTEQAGMQAFIEDNFFIITPDNLDQVTSRIYGYAWDGEQIYLNSPLEHDLTAEASGVYTKLLATDTLIKIEHGINFPGLYYFRHDGWFAISNSFFYLVKYLCGKVPLTFNHDYAVFHQTSGWATFSYAQTMIHEISALPKGWLAIIDKQARRLELVKKRIPNQRVALDSQEGMEILDAWQLKWSRRLCQLQQKGRVSLALSGGFDSRALFSCFVNPLLDLNGENLNIFSNTHPSTQEDLEISQAIAQRYGFTLNRALPPVESCPISGQTFLDIFFLTKLGFHVQTHFNCQAMKSLNFAFYGGGGEGLRNYWSVKYHNTLHFIEQRSNMSILKRLNSAGASGRCLLCAAQEVSADYGVEDINDKRILDLWEYNVLAGNHFGKYYYQNFLHGSIILMPLFDTCLYRLSPYVQGNQDKNLLFALIYQRYTPKIMDVRLDKGKRIDPATMALASRINEKYPLKSVYTQPPELTIADHRIRIPEADKADDPKAALLSLYESENIRSQITALFGKNVWYEGMSNLKRDLIYNTDSICSLLAAAIIKDMLDGQNGCAGNEDKGE